MSAQPAADLLATYRQAETLLNAGQVRQAADLCKQMLDSDPEFAYGYHLMASLFRVTGNLDKALSFADMAIKHGPDVALFHIHQGQIWLLRGHLPAAAIAFKKASQLASEDPVPFILCANTRARQGKFAEALDIYQRARTVSDVPEIDEHEGVCLQMKGDLPAAETMFDRLIARAPQHPSGYIHKARLLVRRNNDAEAETLFTRAIGLNPKAYDALLALAMLHYRQRRLPKAVECATRAVAVNPGNWHGLVLLGGLLVAAHDFAAAEKIFRQALLLQPDNVYAMRGLVNVLLPQHRLPEALSYVEQALARQPQHPVLLYFQAMLKGQTVDTAPREYVAGLFDGYAEHFDQHLQQTLSYRAPAQLAAMMRALPKLQGKKQLSLLDLGCGTGLAAEAFRDVTALRVGVDVSARMLEKAVEKQLYGELHQYDAVMYLLASTRKFDLVVATDVFIYIGAMAPFMKAARNVMGEDSLLGFSIEAEEGDGFHLNDTGRYSHSYNYVLKTAVDEGYALVGRQDIALRVEADKPTKGALFIFKKTPTH